MAGVGEPVTVKVNVAVLPGFKVTVPGESVADGAWLLTVMLTAELTTLPSALATVRLWEPLAMLVVSTEVEALPLDDTATELPRFFPSIWN